MPQNPFKKQPPPKKPRKSKTPETLDKALEKVLIRKAVKDPEWAFAAAKHKFGLMLPQETEDPVERVERETLAELLKDDPEFREALKAKHLRESSAESIMSLDEKLSELALESIESDPELLKQAVADRVQEIVGRRRPASDSLGELLETWHTVKEIEEELGGKKNGGFFTPQLVSDALKVLPAFFGREIQQTVYVVEVNGTLQEMNAEGYRQFLQQKQQRELPLQTQQLQTQQSPSQQLQPYPQPVQSQVQQSQPVQSQPVQSQSTQPQPTQPQPAPSRTLSISDWLPYLDKPPEEFVEALISASEDDGNEQARAILNLLSEHSVEELLVLFAQYRDDPTVGKAVKALESHKEWLQNVVKLIGVKEWKNEG